MSTMSSAYYRDYYAKNIVKRRAYNAAYVRARRAARPDSAFNARVANPAKALHRAARERCNKSGLEFTISVSDIRVPKVCPVLGLVLQHGRGPGGALPTSPSLDRIDSARGYTPGNIRVISKRANTLKNNATLSELALVLRDAKILAGFEDD